MKIIDTVKKPIYCQWCSGLVRKIFTRLHLKRDGQDVKLIEITSVDEKCINLLVDDIPFIIRTWNHIPSEHDGNGLICAETVTYSLFCPDPNYNGVHDGLSEYGTHYTGGVVKVKWNNDPEKHAREVIRYNKRHGLS